MPADMAKDDVIRIRVDTASVVQEFLDLLAVQAAEGETNAPANPGNRAVFRELAPFRLVEYSYVAPGIGGIRGAYLGFPDGSIYAVADEIPEAVVDAAVSGAPTELAPIYIYVVLDAAQPPAAIDQFLLALSAHLGRPLVGVHRDAAGRMAARVFDGEGGGACPKLEAAVIRSAVEADRHFTRERVLERYAARFEGPDGRAWAQFTYDFTRHVVEFPSAAARDDFIDWFRTLCDWIAEHWSSWEDFGFNEILRPAEMAPAPTGEIVAVPLTAPSAFDGGRPWQAFGGIDAASAQAFGASAAAGDEAALRRSLNVARDYWSYCRSAIDAAERKAREAAGRPA